MGGMFSAIEAEEKVLRLNEDRQEIYDEILEIEEPKSE